VFGEKWMSPKMATDTAMASSKSLLPAVKATVVGLGIIYFDMLKKEAIR